MKIEIRCEGYLGRDFELKQSNRTNSSFAVGTLGVSGTTTNGNQPNNNMNESEPSADDNTTTWFDLTLFGDQVQQTYQYFQKGMRVEVVGNLTFSTFVDRNNQTRESKRIFVREIRHVCLPNLGPELLNLQRQASAQRQQNQGSFNNNNRYNGGNNFNGNQGGFGGNNNQGSFGGNGGFGGNNNQAGFGSTGGFGGNNNQGGFGGSSSSNSAVFGNNFGNEGNVNSFAKNNNSFGSSSFPNSSTSGSTKSTETKSDDSDDIPF